MLTSKIPIENQILKVFPNFILSLNIFYFPFQLNLSLFSSALWPLTHHRVNTFLLCTEVFSYIIHSLLMSSNLNIMAEG